MLAGTTWLLEMLQGLCHANMQAGVPRRRFQQVLQVECGGEPVARLLSGGSLLLVQLRCERSLDGWYCNGLLLVSNWNSHDLVWAFFRSDDIKPIPPVGTGLRSGHGEPRRRRDQLAGCALPNECPDPFRAPVPGLGNHVLST